MNATKHTLLSVSVYGLLVLAPGEPLARRYKKPGLNIQDLSLPQRCIGSLVSSPSPQPDMLQYATFFLLSVAYLSSKSFATCPTERPVELCCETLAPYDKDYIVLFEVCGIAVLNTNITVGTDCEFPPADGW